MGKKDKKPKKISAKKEKYIKFRKEKSAVMDVSMPELTDEQIQQKKRDEMSINSYLRFNKNLPTREISERKMRSKR